MVEPSLNGSNGRDNRGRFKPGNKLGRGNPHGRKVNELRTAILDAVSGEDLREIVEALIEKAKSGDVTAAREVFDRTVGRPLESDVQEKLAELEAIITEVEAAR